MPQSLVNQTENANSAPGSLAARPSLLRAWLTLLRLSCVRLVWSLQSLAALCLILLLAAVVLLVTLYGREHEQFRWNIVSFGRAMVDNVYLRFMLPVLCLCFGTQAFGGEWEERNLVWLLTRPIPRPLIYLAKYLATLPWCLGLSLAGFFLMGLLAGPVGRQAVVALWPVLLLGGLAYAALFVLLGCWFRRSTVIGVTYCFVLETIFSQMPGLVKRVSIAFYTRCHFYDLAGREGWDTYQGKPGLTPERISFFIPVDGRTAQIVLASGTLGLLLLGMLIFARREYRDLT